MDTENPNTERTCDNAAVTKKQTRLAALDVKRSSKCRCLRGAKCIAQRAAACLVERRLSSVLRKHNRSEHETVKLMGDWFSTSGHSSDHLSSLSSPWNSQCVGSRPCF
jgi:hypothetical protein